MDMDKLDAIYKSASPRSPDLEDVAAGPIMTSPEIRIALFTAFNAPASTKIEIAERERMMNEVFEEQEGQRSRTRLCTPPPPSKLKTPPPPTKLYTPLPPAKLWRNFFGTRTPNTTLTFDSPPTPTTESGYRESVGIDMAKQRLKERQSIIQKMGRPIFIKNKIPMPTISPVPSPYHGIYESEKKKVAISPERYLAEIPLKESQEFRENEESMKENQEVSPKKKVPKKSPAVLKNSQILNSELPPSVCTKIGVDGSNLSGISESATSKIDNSLSPSILGIQGNIPNKVEDLHGTPTVVVVDSPSGVSAVAVVTTKIDATSSH